MKTHEEIKALLKVAHKEVKEVAGHAIELWEDGEITSTKCARGELYGARNLHSIRSGGGGQTFPLELFPVIQQNNHAFVRVESIDEAEALWKEMTE